VAALCMWGAALTSGGLPDQGTERSAAAVELARELGQPFNVVYALTWEAGIRWWRGDLAEARAAAEAAVAIADEQGFTDFAGIDRVLRGTTRALLAPNEEALKDCLEGMQLAASTGRRGMAPLFLEMVAQCQRALGRPDDARGVVGAALDLAAETDQHSSDPRLLCLRAELRRHAGEAAEAEDDFQRGIEIAQHQADVLSELRCATGLAAMLAGSGDHGAGERIIRPALAKLSEGLTTPIAKEAAALLGKPQTLSASS
jgi:tetratricopeptide (TPR) repeat protein